MGNPLRQFFNASTGPIEVDFVLGILLTQEGIITSKMSFERAISKIKKT